MIEEKWKVSGDERMDVEIMILSGFLIRARRSELPNNIPLYRYLIDKSLFDERGNSLRKTVLFLYFSVVAVPFFTALILR